LLDQTATDRSNSEHLISLRNFEQAAVNVVGKITIVVSTQAAEQFKSFKAKSILAVAANRKLVVNKFVVAA